MNRDYMRRMQEVLDDPGYTGPPERWLMCYPYCHINGEMESEPEFIARVTPDKRFSFQRWEMSSCVQFTGFCGVPGKDSPFNLFYIVRELDEAEYGTHVAFGTFPVYNVKGEEISGFD